MQNSDPRHAATPRMIDDSAGDHPFREYISAMALQLAQLARSEGEGDEALANVLEQAATLATGPRDERSARCQSTRQQARAPNQAELQQGP